MLARSITKALGGDWHGRCGLVPGPGHSRRDRSLQIADTKDGGIIVHSHAGDNWQDCRDYLKGLGWDIDGGQDHRPRSPVYQDTAVPDDEAEKRRRIESAWTIFVQCHPAAGSPVETYIRARGATLPPNAPVYYHPACPNGPTVKMPAMVCPITDIRTKRFIAIHRTFIRPDGSGKADIPKKDQKKMYGPYKGGVVRLSPDDEVTTGLGICEGIETGLSVLNYGWWPVWAALSDNGIRDFPVLDGIECLTIFADHDKNEAGQKAALACASCWVKAGREVFILKPKKAGTDWNNAGKSHV